MGRGTLWRGAIGWSVLVAALLALAGAFWLWRGGASDGADGTGGAGRPLWASRAELAQRELDGSFWDAKRELYNNASPCILQACTDPFNYWWLAHAADVLTDGFLRTGDPAYAARLGELYDGLLARNAEQWTNGYYDDMAWMGLAWLRAYDATQETKYKEAALALWADIKTGWNDESGGGIAWRKEQTDYKNAPANGPAAILAARLYERFGGEDDLAWAERIYDWERRTLVDPDTGIVWDGINRTGDGAIDKGWLFTYNQGTWIGAGVELYRATKERRYLDDAKRTAAAAADALAGGPEGLLPDEGEGDGALFKGIFARYLGELAEVDPQPEPWVRLLRANADTLWQASGAAEARDGAAKRATEAEKRGSGAAEAAGAQAGGPPAAGAARFGTSWAQEADTVVQLGAQLSGTTLLETMARLEKAGAL